MDQWLETKRLPVHFVSAAGVPKLIAKNMVKGGAVVIDVGINRGEDGKICGDVDL